MRRDPVPLLCLGLVSVTVLLLLARLPASPFQEWVQYHLNYHRVALESRAHVIHLLSVPFGSLIVVTVRLVVGLPMLGPFRPLLIATGLMVSGIVAGLLFIVAILAVVTFLRPRLRGGWLPYFGRLSLLLSIVVTLCLAAILFGTTWEWERLQSAGLFPVVVLCLTADGFARASEEHGLRNAVLRAVTTVGIALAICLLMRIPFLLELLLVHPELVFVEIAGIVWIATRTRRSRGVARKGAETAAPAVAPTEADSSQPSS